MYADKWETMPGGRKVLDTEMFTFEQDSFTIRKDRRKRGRKVMDSLFAVIAVVLKLAPFFAVWYAVLYIRHKKTKPANVYNLKPQKYEIWYRNNQKIQLLLAVGYLFLGAAAFLPGYWYVIPVIFLLAVYAVRMINNMSRIE